jgi:predicted dehydrogenase
VAACCDVLAESVAGFQSEFRLPDSHCFTDYQEFVSADLDAVVIVTPVPFHAEQTVAALSAGLHVLCEVTAANSIEGCARIVETVRRTGKIYMMAENCVYWPFIQDWKKLVREGRLGEVFYSECEYVHPIADLIVDAKTGESKWRAARAPLEYCSHSLGPILEITGDRITRAMGLGQGHRMLPAASVGGIDIQVALFETERKAIIKLLRSSVAPRDGASHHYYSLQGTLGFLCTDRQPPKGKGLLYVAGEMKAAQEVPCDIVDRSLPEAASEGGHGTAEYEIVQEFVQAMDTGKRPSIDAVRAMDMTVPGLLAHQSAMRGGCWLDVPSYGGLA